ncbi:helix-turn-helix transcriptional regulator [Streptosporangium sp. NPDC020072]|uniref:helix-turn-helix domain-containing protein n=1 Tax=Streptosporangium sp. NPDC020072 TaxID=3154788 RepID=UPI003440C252
MAVLSDEELAVRRVIGARLRQLRLHRGLTAATAGAAIGASESKISRLETGHRGWRRDDLLALLTLYGVTDPYQRETVLSVAFGERLPAWWDGEDIPLEATAVLGFEQTADLLRTYQRHVIPSLLQTPAYAAAALRTSQAFPPPEDKVQASVDNILRRQQILTSGKKPRLWAIIDEPVLWRSIAGVKAQREQLGALLTAVETNPRITIQVNPMTCTTFMPNCPPMTIFQTKGRPEVVALHRYIGDEIYSQDESEDYAMVFDRLAVTAQRISETPATLARILDQLHLAGAQ